MMSFGFIVSYAKENQELRDWLENGCGKQLNTFKLLEIDCIVTERPWMSVAQLWA